MRETLSLFILFIVLCSYIIWLSISYSVTLHYSLVLSHCLLNLYSWLATCRWLKGENLKFRLCLGRKVSCSLYKHFLQDLFRQKTLTFEFFYKRMAFFKSLVYRHFIPFETGTTVIENFTHQQDKTIKC